MVLESTAKFIRTYEVHFVPGLLLTGAYAEAVVRLHHEGEREVERRVDVRQKRQRLVLGDGTPQLWSVVDEAALSHQIAGPAVMREQLDFLIHASTLRDVSIQVLPAAAEPTMATGNSFSMVRLRTMLLSDVVYLEQIDSAMFLHSAYESDPYGEAWGRLVIKAKTPEETLSFLQRARSALQ